MAQADTIPTLAEVPRYQARNHPDKTALRFGDRETTYRAFDRHCSRVAHALTGEGLRPGDRVAFLGKNSDHYFELLFGAIKAGAVMVPVNWRLAPPEVSYNLDDSAARVVFVEPDFLPVIDRIRGELAGVRRIVVMGEPRSGEEGYTAWRDRQDDADPDHIPQPSDPALQLYTSGTTGRPKGVELSHHTFLALRGAGDDPELEGWERWYDDDVCLIAMPVFHIAGSGLGIQGLYYGVRNIVVADFVPSEVLSIIHHERVSKLFLVPAAIQFLLADPACAETDFSSVRYVLYGASPIPLDLLRQALEVFDAGFVQLYGMTETCGQATYLPPEDHTPQGNQRMRSAGKPMRGIELAVLDPDSGRKLATGEVGEVAIRSPTNMTGYWHLPEATEKTMQEGWVRTGDAGYLDEDGYVYIHDRIKDMIISGGENIYPAELESALYSHPDVADVAVIGVPDERWGEAAKAVIVPAEGVEPDPDAILAFARERLAGYKVPKSVDFVEALPRNPTGKLLKRDLREPYWQDRERRVN